MFVMICLLLMCCFFRSSGLIRESEPGLNEFVKHDGFSVLLRAMQTPVEKLQTKAAFMMSALCQQKPAVKGLVRNCTLISVCSGGSSSSS
jgi:hsp70-interacting protein